MVSLTIRKLTTGRLAALRLRYSSSLSRLLLQFFLAFDWLSSFRWRSNEPNRRSDQVAYRLRKIDFVNAKEVTEQEQEVVDALVKLEPNDRIELAELLKMRWLAE
jgi:hypothetical protein